MTQPNTQNPTPLASPVALGYSKDCYHFLACTGAHVTAARSERDVADKLLVLAPLEQWANRFRRNPTQRNPDAPFSRTRAVDALIRDCERKGHLPPSVLQGIHDAQSRVFNDETLFPKPRDFVPRTLWPLLPQESE